MWACPKPRRNCSFTHTRHSAVRWRLMLGGNLFWVAKQHGHSVEVMLCMYAAWIMGATNPFPDFGSGWISLITVLENPLHDSLLRAQPVKLATLTDHYHTEAQELRALLTHRDGKQPVLYTPCIRGWKRGAAGRRGFPPMSVMVQFG
jgi:hypothetical protein